MLQGTRIYPTVSPNITMQSISTVIGRASTKSGSLLGELIKVRNEDPKSKVKVYKGLLSLTDMGGRRRLLDRRSAMGSPYIPERRRFDRRSGFDRRGILNCSIRNKLERRAEFSKLLIKDALSS